jgi:hypothetical protein
MAQKAMNPQPGRVMDTRGVGVESQVDKTQRKTGYRADAQPRATDNSIDPDSLVRINTDPRTA